MPINSRMCLIATLLLFCAGCGVQRTTNLSRQTGGSAFLFHQFQCYDGRSGRPISFSELVRKCRSADVVLFGEAHGNAVCNQIEAQLFHALLQTGRPAALAMEFFEADTQAPLDAYLSGRLDEPGFAKQAHRGHTYYGTHRPLIELTRSANVPVLAANAPRRLVHQFRKSGLDYDAFRASVSAEDRQWLPVTYTYIGGDYRSRFAEIMGASDDETSSADQPAASPTSRPAQHAADKPKHTPTPTSPGVTVEPVTQPGGDAAGKSPASVPPPAAVHSFNWKEFYRAQLLWDDAMSESIANYRDRYPRRRVMLVVGGFHVEYDGGTAQKLRRRRPGDKVVTVTYRSYPNGQFAFDPDDKGAGDVVVYGLTFPKPEKKTEAPTAEKKAETSPADAKHPAPESQPTSAPTTTPTSAPASAPTPSHTTHGHDGPHAKHSVAAGRNQSNEEIRARNQSP